MTPLQAQATELIRVKLQECEGRTRSTPIQISPPIADWEARNLLGGLEQDLYAIDDEGYVQSNMLPIAFPARQSAANPPAILAPGRSAKNFIPRRNLSTRHSRQVHSRATVESMQHCHGTKCQTVQGFGLCDRHPRPIKRRRAQSQDAK